MEPHDLVPLLKPWLENYRTIVCPTDAIATAIAEMNPKANIISEPVESLDDESTDVVVLLDGQVATRGIKGPVLIAESLRILKPKGHLCVAVPSKLPLQMKGETGGLSSSEIDHMLRERGVSIELLSAPGASARLGNRQFQGIKDLPLDSTPGFLDTGEYVLAVARKWVDFEERSRHFFDSLPMRMAAGAVICFHPEDPDKILCVYDSFKDAWTIPGGVIDAYESPAQGAQREALEEAGVKIKIDKIGGIFTHSYPERIHFLYFASVDGKEYENPITQHPHEIGEVRWLPMKEAEEKISHYMWDKISSCINEPGRTWDMDNSL